jgi:uncharacterized protein (TIGR02145 family)
MEKLGLNFIAITAIFMFAFAACKDDDKPVTPLNVNEGILTDTRDNITYKTIRIGTQTWMAENLRYSGSLSSGNLSVGAQDCDSDCGDPQVKYNKAGAQVACPTGWHLASDLDWRLLEHKLGMSDIDTAKVKDNTRGLADKTGTKLYNGGSSKINIVYLNYDLITFWTSSATATGNYVRTFDPNNKNIVHRSISNSTAFFCVRCMQN